LQRISDSPDLIRTVYHLKKQRPTLKMRGWYGTLSEDSPDFYHNAIDDFFYSPPLYIRFVKAGSRIGYRWDTQMCGRNPCEVNWLDPEPDRESSDYKKELRQIESQVKLYRGFHQPPTQEEYTTLFAER
jgi:hypothetical protein